MKKAAILLAAFLLGAGIAKLAHPAEPPPKEGLGQVLMLLSSCQVNRHGLLSVQLIGTQGSALTFIVEKLPDDKLAELLENIDKAKAEGVPVAVLDVNPRCATPKSKAAADKSKAKI